MGVPAATRIFAPFLAGVLSKDLAHWAPTMISFSMKIVAMTIACFIQMFISAFYSCIRGGKMVGNALINIATERGIMDMLPDSLTSKPFDPDMSYLDEFVAYPLAAFGFYYQIISGFAAGGLPVQIILFPLTII